MLIKKSWLPLAAIIVLAAIIRLVTAIQWQGLLSDEVFSIMVSRQSVGDIWNLIRWEMHPPLHFYYLHYWIQWFGATPWIIRLSSIIPSLVAIGLLYKLGLVFFSSRRAAFYAALLAAFTPLFGFYSTWARMYALLILFTAGSLLAFWRALQTNKWPWWTLVVILNTLAVYTHLTGLLVPAVQILFLAYLWLKGERDKSRLAAALLAAGSSIVLLAPWLWNFVTLRLQNFSGQAWYFWADSYDLALLNIPLNALIVGNQNKLIELVALPIFLGVLVLAFFRWQKDRLTSLWLIRSQVSPGLALSGLVVLLGLLGPLFANLTPLRFYIIMAVGLYLVLGAGLANMENIIARCSPGKSLKIQTVMVLVIIALLLSANVNLLTLPSTGWPEVARFLESEGQPGDKIVASLYSDLLQIEYFYQGDLPYDGVIDKDKRDQDLVLTALKYNFIPSANKENVAQLADMTAGHDRIFLLFSNQIFVRSQELVLFWFFQQGWQLAERFEHYGFTNPQVFVLTRPD